MPDITLSPIPYNGGTLSMTNVNSHICSVDTGKFVAVFGQTNPNYTFAAVINVTNLKTGTASATVATQRVMSQNALTRARVWKLANNRVLALLNSDLVVFEIQPNDDIVQKAGTITGFHNTYLWGAEAATAYSSTTGTQIYGQFIKDNVVWICQRATATGPIVMKKIVYDPVADTLTATQILQFAASATATHFTRFHIQKVPNTANWFVYLNGANNTAINTTSVTQMYFLDYDGTILTTVNAGIPTTVRALVPLSMTNVLGLVDTRTYRYWNGTTWTTADTVFAGATTATTAIIDAEAIDSNYFMIASTTTGIELAAAAPAYSYRVSRFVDAVFGQTSPSTNTTNGLSYTTANAYFDQKVLNPHDSETFLIYGRNSATQFRIRVLYQAAS